ncbi:hypothetical protein P3W43_14715 [Salinicola salarius]|nr:hypothetical protein [Salinicola salarius]MDF3920107.1 hypothetical protein [Salinicola salarius]
MDGSVATKGGILSSLPARHSPETLPGARSLVASTSAAADWW